MKDNIFIIFISTTSVNLAFVSSLSSLDSATADWKQVKAALPVTVAESWRLRGQDWWWRAKRRILGEWWEWSVHSVLPESLIGFLCCIPFSLMLGFNGAQYFVFTFIRLVRDANKYYCIIFFHLSCIKVFIFTWMSKSKCSFI